MSNSKNAPENKAAKTTCCGGCDCETCTCGCPKGECRCRQSNCQCGCRKPATVR